MIKKNLILFITMLFFVQTQSQKLNDDKSEVDLFVDELFEDEVNLQEDEFVDSVFLEDKELDNLINDLTQYRFLYFSVDYNNATYFTGRDLGIEGYNLRPQITYMDSKGFFASLSSICYQEFDPQWDFIAIALGYGKSLGKDKRIRLTASYSRFIYLNDLDNVFTNSIAIGVGLRNKKRTLGTRLSTTFSFGGDESYQISSNSFLRLKLFKNNNSSLYFRPSLTLQVGDQVVYQESVVEIGGEEYIDYEEQNVFNLLNVQYSLPLLYTYKNFDFELSYHINTPFSHGAFEYDKTSFLNFSMAYLLEL